MIISVDPGVKATGIAVFDDGELAFAFLARGADWFATAKNAHDKLCERLPLDLVEQSLYIGEVPQVYQARHLKGDPNDLIDVTLVFAALVGCKGLAPVLYRPREWKGQVPKRVSNDRIWSKLSDDERQRVELPPGRKKTAGALSHNVIDAIGIGLHYLRRGEKRSRASGKRS